MKNKIIILVLILTCSSVLSVRAAENKKIAQTGFQFLSVSCDAKASAMAGAVTSTELQSNALFYNPAAMANMPGFFSASFSQNKWIADIDYNAASLAVNPFKGQYGVFGLSVLSVDYGDLIGTRVDQNPASSSGFVETGAFSPSAMAIGFGYAKALTDRFSVGGQVKWTHQELGENEIMLADGSRSTLKNELSPLGFDFGTLFKTGFKSLAFGMSVRNFSQEIKFQEEGFQLPMIFQMGISMDLMDLMDWHGVKQNLLLSIDATHDRSHSEQLIVGLDYTLMKMLSVRGGYVSNNDEDSISYGLGVSYMGAVIDYAYTPFGIFDSVQRFTVRFSL
jgi:hypothetical protein